MEFKIILRSLISGIIGAIFGAIAIASVHYFGGVSFSTFNQALISTVIGSFFGAFFGWFFASLKK